MARTVSLKGAAAKAFMGVKSGVKATTDEERVERILMMLELQLKDGTKQGCATAAKVVLSLARDGLTKTADALT